MLRVHRAREPGGGREVAAADLKGFALPARGGWIDLLDPSPDEVAAVEAATGLTVPTRDQLSEVEVSSRLRRDGAAIVLSLPIVFRDAGGLARVTPVGFALSADHLVTIRFETLRSFETCQERVERDEVVSADPALVLVALLEAIVDRLADLLEEAGADLDDLAAEVFGPDLDEKPGQRPKAQDANLRRTLRSVGRSRQLVSKVRATLLGIGRIVPYVRSEAEAWLSDGAVHRLETVRHDVDSLDEYEVHLSDKVQFLLDADLGLINIEQNDRFRILTVVSIVGIPPTFVASLYGMNFKHMPELDWQWGYAYGLAVIAASALVPLVWFKVRGWL